MHEYVSTPPGIVSPSSSETASFIMNWLASSVPLVLTATPVLCVTTQEGVWLLSGSYQSSRLVCGAKLRLIFLSCWNTPGTVSGHTTSSATRWEAQSHLSLKFSMRSVPASPDSLHVTYHPALQCICTPISLFLEDTMFLLVQDPGACSSSAPKVLSQPLHSSAPKNISSEESFWPQTRIGCYSDFPRMGTLSYREANMAYNDIFIYVCF